jgi:uncharacterized protein (TIGR02246 family)
VREIRVLGTRTATMGLAALAMMGVAAVAAGVMSGCSGGPASSGAAGPAMAVDTRAADEEAIRAADLGWSKAAGAKDLAGALSYYAENATVMAPGAPIATGKEAVQKEFAALMGDPNFALSFAPTKVVVARAGDLAYEIGDYQLTLSGKKNKPETVKAKYVVVWTKQGDGSWKSVIDAPTTTVE